MSHGGPAFPAWETDSGIFAPRELGGAELIPKSGMTLRDYFAAKAMQAIITGQPEADKVRIIAFASYLMADAMLEARK